MAPQASVSWHSMAQPLSQYDEHSFVEKQSDEQSSPHTVPQRETALHAWSQPSPSHPR